MIATVDLRDPDPAAVDAALRALEPVVSAPFLRERLDAISVG